VAQRKNWGDPLVKVVVYVEGGGEQRKTLDDCRRGFGQLFEKIVRTGDRPKVVACGGRESAFDEFKRDVESGEKGFLILLVDSEGPVAPDVNSWAHLRTNDRWKKPKAVNDDHAHLMVQCMESWFLADPEALRSYYKRGFLIKSLPRRRNVEEIMKHDVARALENATHLTKTKGMYHKTRHGFDLLALIDPTRLREASGRAQRLFAVLEQRSRM
jgi:hypothetical protein